MNEDRNFTAPESAPEHVTVVKDANDPTVPNVDRTEIRTSAQNSIPEERRADVKDISRPSETTSTAVAHPTGAIDTRAGDQFGEQPSPIPAQFAVRDATAGDPNVHALPRALSSVVQPSPVVTGTHQVVLDTEVPAMKAEAITAPAGKFGVGTLGPFGLPALAIQVYGDASRARDIFDANKDTMVSPDSWLIGQSVRLPD